MEYLIGVVLAAVMCAFAMLTGFDRDRAFIRRCRIFITGYYMLFAVMGSSVRALTIESLVAGLFLVVAVVGFKKNLWFVVAAIAGHGVFDFFHHRLIENPGVPVWWPGFRPGVRFSRQRVLGHAADEALPLRAHGLKSQPRVEPPQTP